MIDLNKDYYTNDEMREIAQKLIDVCFSCVLYATDEKCFKIKYAKSDEIKLNGLLSNCKVVVLILNQWECVGEN